ncbi:MAG: tyrosine-type recombinase/integrase, partial [Burkholderiales bacterium]
MKTSEHGLLFALVESFFTEYLQRMRGASPHTVRAYRDSLKLLFEFIAAQKGCGIVALQLCDLNVEAIAQFLGHLEAVRSNSSATRNCRRAAVRSFFRHLVRHDLTHSQQYMRVLAIPAKRARHRPASYIEADDMRAILAKPDRRTPSGLRDYALLLFLYNTGARVSEAAGLRFGDLQLDAPRQVRLRGKGKRERVLPLWRETATALRRLTGAVIAHAGANVFVNHHNDPLTRDGIAYILRQHVLAATPERPTLARRRITPHVLRHSCAVALLQS